MEIEEQSTEVKRQNRSLLPPKEKISLFQGYFIIIILSLISIFFFPMIGSTVGIQFNLPTTAAGWTVYIISKAAMVLINILIFDQFVKQAKVNVKDNEHYKFAAAAFEDTIHQDEKLLYPKEYFARLYKSKGIKVTLSTLLSVVGLSQAILSFDIITMLTSIFTVGMGAIFGWITMVNVESYWTEDYYKLALKYLEEKEGGSSLKEEPVNTEIELPPPLPLPMNVGSNEVASTRS